MQDIVLKASEAVALTGLYYEIAGKAAVVLAAAPAPVARQPAGAAVNGSPPGPTVAPRTL